VPGEASQAVAVERETLAFVTTLFRENLPVRTLVDADFTFVNERLAQHYQLPSVKGSALRRVMLPENSPLGGLLTQGSILKITANGTATSPVLRGAWIMDRIIGEPPPPLPPLSDAMIRVLRAQCQPARDAAAQRDVAMRRRYAILPPTS